MIAIPFIYFMALFAFFLHRNKGVWNMDLAATALLIAVSFCAILIDLTDCYGDYGINYYSVTFPTILLFCLQWTAVLTPLHLLSGLPLCKHHTIKEKTLYVFLILIAVSSIIMIVTRSKDIIEALVMDLADVRNEHYKDMNGSDDSNYLMLLPNILVSTPFPTMALFFWFYMKAFMKSPFILSTGILLASIVQAIIAIIMAGRAAMIYWAFDFFLLYSFFYRYLSRSVKHRINMMASILGGMAAFLFISITIARFDGTTGRNPLESLYGYAGQHVNNFCTMFVYGGNNDISLDRIFPLTSKIMGKSFELVEHYDGLVAQMPNGILINVFDSFGAEIFLDLGWFGYIVFFILLGLATLVIRHNWQELTFHRVFPLIIFIAFFTRSIFAWPFTGHYTTMALMVTLLSSYFFKYIFRI